MHCSAVVRLRCSGSERSAWTSSSAMSSLRPNERIGARCAARAGSTAGRAGMRRALAFRRQPTGPGAASSAGKHRVASVPSARPRRCCAGAARVLNWHLLAPLATGAPQPSTIAVTCCSWASPRGGCSRKRFTRMGAAAAARICRSPIADSSRRRLPTTAPRSSSGLPRSSMSASPAPRSRNPWRPSHAAGGAPSAGSADSGLAPRRSRRTYTR